MPLRNVCQYFTLIRVFKYYRVKDSLHYFRLSGTHEVKHNYMYETTLNWRTHVFHLTKTKRQRLKAGNKNLHRKRTASVDLPCTTSSNAPGIGVYSLLTLYFNIYMHFYQLIVFFSDFWVAFRCDCISGWKKLPCWSSAGLLGDSQWTLWEDDLVSNRSFLPK